MDWIHLALDKNSVPKSHETHISTNPNWLILFKVFILGIILNTQIHCIGKMASFLNVKVLITVC
jgi:hypothetical protein